jgi:hypothetical protein
LGEEVMTKKRIIANKSIKYTELPIRMKYSLLVESRALALACGFIAEISEDTVENIAEAVAKRAVQDVGHLSKDEIQALLEARDNEEDGADTIGSRVMSLENVRSRT